MTYADFGLDESKKGKDIDGPSGALLCLWCNRNVHRGFSLCFSNFCICSDCAAAASDLQNGRWEQAPECFKCQSVNLRAYRQHPDFHCPIHLCESCIYWATSYLFSSPVPADSHDASITNDKQPIKMKYLAITSNSYTPKNRLENAIQDYLWAQNRTLVDSGDLDEFKARIVSGIDELHLKNPRCKNLRAKWSDSRDRNFGDLILSFGEYGHNSLITFKLFAEKDKTPDEAKSPVWALVAYTYEEICARKIEIENEVYSIVKDAMNGNYQDNTEGKPFNLASILCRENLPYTPESFKKYLMKRSVPWDRMQQLAGIIKREYKSIVNQPSKTQFT